MSRTNAIPMYTHRKKDEGSHRGPVQIRDLFAKYRLRLRPPQGIVVRAFCAVVEEVLGVALPPHMVRYSAGSRIISVMVGGAQKSELIFHQKRILTLCRDTLGEHGAPTRIV